MWWLSQTGDSPDSKDHGANMGPTWVLLAPGGPNVGPMNLAIREVIPETMTQFTGAYMYRQATMG